MKKVKWMEPDEILKKMPHPISLQHPRGPSAFTAAEKDFCQSSLEHLEKKFSKTKMIPEGYVMLHFDNMIEGFPTHEGRHTAYVAKKLGIKKIPVDIYE